MTRVALLGGSGRLGSHLLPRLLAAGCEVSALVHRSSVSTSPSIRLVSGDVHDRGALERLVEDADVIVSTLGSAGAPIPDVSSAAVGNLLPLMNERKIDRIVTTTGSAARLDSEIGREHSWLAVRREMLMAHMSPLILDAEEHMRLLAGSMTRWTVLRLPIMQRELSGTGSLASEPQQPDTRLSFATVADLLVAELLEPRWEKLAPFAVRRS